MNTKNRWCLTTKWISQSLIILYFSSFFNVFVFFLQMKAMEKTLNGVLHKSIIFPFYLINEEDFNKVLVILVANFKKNKNMQRLFLHRLLMYFAQTKQALVLLLVPIGWIFYSPFRTYHLLIDSIRSSLYKKAKNIKTKFNQKRAASKELGYQKKARG